MGLFGDSWASNTAKQTSGQLNSQGSSLFSEGQGIQAQLLPFLRGEMTANHAFTPEQLNELLTSAGAGAGGAAGSVAGEAGLEATRTGNSAALPALLDKISRAKSQGLAKANEGIAASDVNATLENKQAGAAGMESLYGADTGDALKAMGLQQDAIKNQMTASTTGGWMRNLVDSAAKLAGGFKDAGQGAAAFGMV